MSEEKLIYDDFNERMRGYWTNNADYDRVNALLLHWEEDDLTVKPEVERFEALLKNDFHFKARIYPIPSENSGAQLNLELASFIKQNSLQKRSLTIVYYAGHADDVEENSPPGYSEWRAKKDGGPSLNWFMLQQALYFAQGDVLVILDCCRASLKTRGESEGKMEVLAACGSDSRVPAPGTLSFTSVLIRQIRKRLKSDKDISIRWLHNHLFSDKLELGLTGELPNLPFMANIVKLKLSVSPVRFDLSKYDQPSITLKPLVEPPPKGFVRKSSPALSFMFLKVSLGEDPTGLQIANWIKHFPPKAIKGVDIESLVLKARRLEDLKNKGEFFQGPVLGKLSPPAQSEILQKLWENSHVVSSTKAFASEASTTANFPDEASSLSFAENVVSDMTNSVADVCDSIEGGVLLEPGIDLDLAAENEVLRFVGAKDAITLRQYLLDNARIPDKPELPRGTVKLISKHRGGQKRFRYGNIDGKPVVVESFSYTTVEAASSEPPPNTISQIKRMVTQLSHPKRTSFNILPCVGYFQELHARKICVVFALDKGHIMEEPPTALCDFYGLEKRVPLGLRLKLAYALATALEHFHRIGWVHKELKSENIRFLHGASGSVEEIPDFMRVPPRDIELTQPWLFGFECSRPEDADSEMNSEWKNNAYRHPERWGKPRIKFEKYHDVYALGIVFLEIAFWKPVAQFEEMTPSKIDPWVVREQLLARANKDLPHRVGERFATAINACLRFQELTEGLDDFCKHQAYRGRILDVLERTAKCI